jgi:hypothetical protein
LRRSRDLSHHYYEATMLRRSFLRALPISAAAVALPAAAQPIQTPADRLDAAIAELRAATEALYPNVKRWAVVRSEDTDSSCPVAIVAVGAPSAPVKFTGPGIYEFALLDRPYGKGFVQPVAFLDHSLRRDGWYRWQHYHQGKFQGRGHYVPASRIRIIRKVEALGEQA